jgi:putative endonuclease
LNDGYAEAPKEKQWCVYLLQCSDAKQSLYCGITNDLDKRIATHNTGRGAKYTRGKTPVILLKSWNCDSKSQALKEEYRIKQLSRKEKLVLCSDIVANESIQQKETK